MNDGRECERCQHASDEADWFGQYDRMPREEGKPNTMWLCAFCANVPYPWPSDPTTINTAAMLNVLRSDLRAVWGIPQPEER